MQLRYIQGLDNTTVSMQCLLSKTDSACLPGLVLENEVETSVIRLAAVGFGIWAACYLEWTCFRISAARQTRKMREKLFQAILRQQMGWFDTADPGELAICITEYVPVSRL